MKTISHRDMRNNSAEVLKRVAAGDSYTVTNHGTAVAQIIPIGRTAADLPLAQPATRQGGFSSLPRRRVDGTITEALDDLRGER
ncbi:type II toxin-antitoxin system Phd/YefM family antitoxin [Microbacterium sp. NPDC055910]|uniref:type II toxin-antitoxin system Phd/YefM family antitoxin n=1 Tax=Microbacterium sp. NPDC055910 TaxID=3345659 RepID=UPI0035E3008C